MSIVNLAVEAVRKVKEGKTSNDLYAFLTCEPNKKVGAIYPKAMPVILRTPAEWETRLCGGWAAAGKLQRPQPDGSLIVVARGGKSD